MSDKECLTRGECEVIKKDLLGYVDKHIDKIEEVHHNNHRKVYDMLDNLKEMIHLNSEETFKNSITMKQHMENEEKLYKIGYSVLGIIITAMTSVMLFNFFEQKDMREELTKVVVDQENIHMHQMGIEESQRDTNRLLYTIQEHLDTHLTSKNNH